MGKLLVYQRVNFQGVKEVMVFQNSIFHFQFFSSIRCAGLEKVPHEHIPKTATDFHGSYSEKKPLQ